MKFEEFAANGVGEYGILNAEESVIEQYLLRSGVYELVLKSSSGDFKSEVIDGFEIDIAALFKEEANLEALRTDIDGVSRHYQKRVATSQIRMD